MVAGKWKSTKLSAAARLDYIGTNTTDNDFQPLDVHNLFIIPYLDSLSSDHRLILGLLCYLHFAHYVVHRNKVNRYSDIFVAHIM